MSRSGYVDDWDGDEWQLNLAQGARVRAMRGKRGQKFLNDTLVALDALPEPKLAARSLETEDGQVCALGAVARHRGVDMKPFIPSDPDDDDGANTAKVARVFGIAVSMARDIVWENDDCSPLNETPEQRFQRIRAWVASEILPALNEGGGR